MDIARMALLEARFCFAPCIKLPGPENKSGSTRELGEIVEDSQRFDIDGVAAGTTTHNNGRFANSRQTSAIIYTAKRR